MSNLRYIAPIYDRLGGSSALPVAFSMYAVGGRTQGIGVIASWWTTQAAQSRIDWAVTSDPVAPSIGEMSTTSWTEDFVKHHEIPFPETRLSEFHWFRAHSRNSSGQVLVSPLRGIYYVPGELVITHEFLFYEDIQVLSPELLTVKETGNLSLVAKTYRPIASVQLFSELESQQSVTVLQKEIENFNIATSVTIDD